MKAVNLLHLIRSVLPIEAHLAGWPLADSFLKREKEDCNTSKEGEIPLSLEEPEAMAQEY